MVVIVCAICRNAIVAVARYGVVGDVCGVLTCAILLLRLTTLRTEVTNKLIYVTTRDCSICKHKCTLSRSISAFNIIRRLEDIYRNSLILLTGTVNLSILHSAVADGCALCAYETDKTSALTSRVPPLQTLCNIATQERSIYSLNH